jgi:hypothetical protein
MNRIQKAGAIPIHLQRRHSITYSHFIGIKNPVQINDMRRKARKIQKVWKKFRFSSRFTYLVANRHLYAVRKIQKWIRGIFKKKLAIDSIVSDIIMKKQRKERAMGTLVKSLRYAVFANFMKRGNVH